MRYKNIVISILLSFSSICLISGNNKADSLLLHLNSQSADTLKIQALFKIGNEFINNNSDSAKYYYLQALSIAESIEDPIYIAKSFRLIGNTFYYQSSYDSTISYYSKSLTYFIGLSDKKGESRTMSNLGSVFLVKGDYEKAAEYFFKVIKISEQIHDTISLMAANLNIGIVFNKMNELDKALRYYNRALEINYIMNNRNGVRKCLLNIGVIYKDQNKDQEALNVFNQALEMNRSDDDLYGVSVCYRNIGEVYQNMHRPTKAHYYFLEAKSVDEKIGNLEGLASCNISIARNYNEYKKYDLALPYAAKALGQARDLGILSLQKEANKELYISHLNKQNFKEALEYHIAYKTINDSIFNLESSKQIKELQTKYETEKKEIENESLRKENQIKSLELRRQREIRNYLAIFLFLVTLLIFIVLSRIKVKKKANIALRKKNKLIEEQAENLKEANKTKDKFFAIIAHDLKNPFNVIMGFASLLEDNYDSFDDEKRKSFIARIASSSENTFNLLNNLLEWARSQTNKITIKPEEINLAELVNISILPYKASANKKQIQLHTEIPESATLIIDRYTTSTVISNLVSNSIKFTEEGGSIHISGIEREEDFLIRIQDSGIGMAPEVQKNLFNIENVHSTEGTNKETGTGMGIHICKEFMELNHGRIEVESQIGIGTTFMCYLPKKVS